MNLSENLKVIRKENNLSQEQLAEKLGVSRQAVSKWESCQSYPEMDKMTLICKLFNYNIDDLMNKNIMDINENKKTKINKSFSRLFNIIIKMRCRDILKCLLENLFMCIIAFAIFELLSAVLGHIFATTLGFLSHYAFGIIKNITEILLTIIYITITVVILWYRFKTRYLDRYEVENVDKKNI